jgi:hypothetical protein
MVGRVFGALMIADRPEMSSKEHREAWARARASLSQVTRVLESLGFIWRFSRGGKKRGRRQKNRRSRARLQGAGVRKTGRTLPISLPSTS